MLAITKYSLYVTQLSNIQHTCSHVLCLQDSFSANRIQQLEAENSQLRQAASKRSQALSQARHFIDNNLQRSTSVLKESPGGNDPQGNGVQTSPAPKSGSSNNTSQ